MFSPFLVFVLLGCKSITFGPYVSPRVAGQVLATDSRQPLRGVRVSRVAVDSLRGSPPKGAELLMSKAPVLSDESGRFELTSERVLSIVRGAGWNVVSLSFEYPGYRRLQTNCPINNVTNTVGGEPLLDVGQMFLQPATTDRHR